MNSIITYESLYDLLRREKTHPELQKLDQNFLEEISRYVQDKLAILESQKAKSSIFSSKESQLTVKQIENINHILKELYEKRETKIIQLALSSSRTRSKYDTSNLLEEEKRFYETLKTHLNNFRNEITEKVLSKEAKTIKRDEKPGKQVRFLKPISQFIGTDLQTYGPFEETQTATLPREVAELLIQERRAEEHENTQNN